MNSNPILTDSGRNKPIFGEKTNTIDNYQFNKNQTPHFLGLAAGAVVLSLGLTVSKKKRTWTDFLGFLGPSFLLVKAIDKIVQTRKSSNSKNHTFLH